MTFVWFLLLVVILTAVHELGHFAMARLFDVGVLRLSIGFGPTLAKITRGGTEYVISAIPFGGYVRLVGEDPRDAIAPTQRAQAFSGKPAWQRLAIIFAGPLANLLFPFLVFVALEANRSVVLAPIIGTVYAGQPAAEADLRAGDRVVAIDGERVHSWDDLNQRITLSPGRELRIAIERGAGEPALTKIVTPRLHRRRDGLGGESLIGLLGIAPHARLAQVGVVDSASPAGRAGLASFDVITSIQGRPISTAAELTSLISPRSGDRLLVTFLRARTSTSGGASIAELEPGSALVIPDALSRIGGGGGYDAGVRAADEYHSDLMLFAFGAEGPRAVAPSSVVPLERAPLASLWHGLVRTISATATMARVLFATLIGRLPSSTLGGPILLYQVAGVAAERGAGHYLRMAALVSLNLGLLNLLPIPLLDGGQASLVLLERVRKRPISENALRRATLLGVILLIALMLVASRNDLARYLLQ